MSDLPNTAMSLLRLNPSTKSQIKSFCRQVKESIDEGETNALDVLVQCRAIEKTVKELLPQIKEAILKESEKYPDKDFDYLGNRLEKTEAGVEYDYAATGDPIWERLDADANTAIERRKEREAFLRVIKAGDIVNVVDPESGEEVTLKPAPKTSTSIVKVSIR